ncbi:hypothetical protein HG536_0F00600 [Torulaspora globosa]|uniref:Origin recognition complex subunit 4 C-terminal domain-containing protein n=1 Tax=Torulaspora globosa TaxID=48254 RepID=A0A7G3ZJP9_9SACH|nr:uncharacterized protein HG536_0F00600 [Torulaspora globosa]QLL33735.1 hypothetical protein HG536_0F00600 [Torulaspora globosa]
MEAVDSEFGSLRKSKGKASSGRILKDSAIDHEQKSMLQKLTLLPIKKVSSNKVKKPNHISETRESTSLAEMLIERQSENMRMVRKTPASDLAVSRKLAKPLDPDFKRFKHHLLRAIYQGLPSQDIKVPSYLQDVQAELNRILSQAIVQKESHSTIIVGPRESYKTFLLDHEMALLANEYAGQFITIRLNGFIHSEQSAINGIATQFEQQLRKLRGTTDDTANGSDISSGSLTEVFEKILRVLDSTSIRNQNRSQKNGAVMKITVVFIFDEIDTFAGPVRQSLLYNLFDMVEHAKVPVCIFGCTTKLNILEYLEKRVKSRFSQRIIYMPQIESLEQFVELTGELLTVSRPSEYKYAGLWNQKVKETLADEKGNFYKLAKINYETFRSLPHFKNGIVPLIYGAEDFESLCKSLETCDIINKYEINQLGSSLSATVASLSDLQLAILICAARAALKAKDEVMNFNLTYAEYESMTKSLNARIPTVAHAGTSRDASSVLLDSAIKLWKKKDVKNVWETLISLNLLTEKSAIGLRESAMAVFYASNYQLQGTTIPFDLRQYQTHVTLSDLRRIVPSSSLYYPWTQL